MISNHILGNIKNLNALIRNQTFNENLNIFITQLIIIDPQFLQPSLHISHIKNRNLLVANKNSLIKSQPFLPIWLSPKSNCLRALLKWGTISWIPFSVIRLLTRQIWSISGMHLAPWKSGVMYWSPNCWFIIRKEYTWGRGRRASLMVWSTLVYAGKASSCGIAFLKRQIWTDVESPSKLKRFTLFWSTILSRFL